MSTSFHRRRLLCLLAMIIAPLVDACTMVAMLRPVPGADESVLHSGVTRASVDAALGAPLREWKAPSGEQYALYHYDAGHSPSILHALGMGYMDFLSLGAWEGMALALPKTVAKDASDPQDPWDPEGKTKRGFRFNDPLEPPHEFKRIIVIYDASGIVRGTTEPFDAAPKATATR